MELPKTTEARIQCIRDAAARLGGNAALGRALGYRDGAFIGQMLRGERPVTEKTLLAMGGIHQLSDLFSRPHPTLPDRAVQEVAENSRPPVIPEDEWKSLTPRARALVEDTARQAQAGRLTDQQVKVLHDLLEQIAQPKA